MPGGFYIARFEKRHIKNRQHKILWDLNYFMMRIGSLFLENSFSFLSALC